MSLRIRSEYDRSILRLAVPALGALAAEPLYLLADTAMVGHLGTRELAALAAAGTLLTGSFTLFNFLTYGTTAQVARLHGAGQEVAAGRLAAQALWLSAAIGVALLVVMVALADPLVSLFGTEGRTADMAVDYLRVAALGLPAALVALAGQGYLRGIADLRTPLVILVVANAANVVLGLVLIYGVGMGFIGSAVSTVIAQLGMGAAFTWALLRAPADDRRPALAPDAPADAHRRPDLRAHRGAVRVVPGGRRRAGARGRRRPGRAPGGLPAVRVPGAGAGLRSPSPARCWSGARWARATPRAPTRRRGG